MKTNSTAPIRLGRGILLGFLGFLSVLIIDLRILEAWGSARPLALFLLIPSAILGVVFGIKLADQFTSSPERARLWTIQLMLGGGILMLLLDAGGGTKPSLTAVLITAPLAIFSWPIYRLCAKHYQAQLSAAGITEKWAKMICAGSWCYLAIMVFLYFA